MVDLNERLRSSADAFTQGLHVPNPAQDVRAVGGSSSGGSDHAPDDLHGRTGDRDRRGRRWSVAALATSAAIVAAVLFIDTGSQSQLVVPAVESTSGPTATSIVGLELSPADRVRAAYATTLESPSFVMTSSVEDASGEPVDGGGANGASSMVYAAPGLVSVTTRIMDGSWVTNGYYDVTAGRQYWLVETGRWKSAAMGPWDSPLVSIERDPLEGAPCVIPVDDLRLLIVRAPAGPCPATAPAPSDWASLGTSKQVVTLTVDGRLAGLRTTADESPIEVPGIGAVSMVTTFSDYDRAPAVALPDPSVVTEVTLRADGSSGLSGTTGFQTKDEVSPCGTPTAAEGCVPD